MNFGKLDPLAKNGVSDPINRSITAIISFLLHTISWFLLFEGESSLGNPVVFLRAEDLTKESDLGSTAQLGKFF